MTHPDFTAALALLDSDAESSLVAKIRAGLDSDYLRLELDPEVESVVGVIRTDNGDAVAIIYVAAGDWEVDDRYFYPL